MEQFIAEGSHGPVCYRRPGAKDESIVTWDNWLIRILSGPALLQFQNCFWFRFTLRLLVNASNGIVCTKAQRPTGMKIKKLCGFCNWRSHSMHIRHSAISVSFLIKKTLSATGKFFHFFRSTHASLFIGTTCYSALRTFCCHILPSRWRSVSAEYVLGSFFTSLGTRAFRKTDSPGYLFWHCSHFPCTSMEITIFVSVKCTGTCNWNLKPHPRATHRTKASH